MVNINCVEDCIYQEMGKCTLECVVSLDSIDPGKCTYFVKKNGKKLNQNQKHRHNSSN